MRILNFKRPRENINSLYKHLKINRIKNIILISNCQLVLNQIQNNLLKHISKYFPVKTKHHLHNTRGKELDVPKIKTSYYQSDSISLKAIKQ